jgi:adenylosuccinate synthase
MRHSAVIGLGFGDEGKGIATDFLCSQSSNPLVVRFSGGHQAGHTVVYNGIRHVFSSFGSGTLRGVPTYFSKFCTISPIAIYNEYKDLEKKGITPTLYIDKDCPIITPYDKLNNIQEEVENKHGSCGVGFGSTIEREENNYHLLAGDFFYPSVFKIKLKMIRDYYLKDGGLDVSDFLGCCNWLMSCNNIKIVNEWDVACITFSELIYEGSQGLLLDKDIGFFPNVTRSNTGTKNLFAIKKHPCVSLEIDPLELKIYIVTRAYQTRHGNGEMTNLDIPHNIKSNPLETNVRNKYQGDFRRSLLDLDLLEYAKEKDDHIREATLVITCLDHVVNEYRFTYKGEIVCCDNEKDFVTRIAKILKCDKVLLSHSDESKNIDRIK